MIRSAANRSFLTLAALLALAVGVGLLVSNQKAIGRLRTENEQLLNPTAETKPVTAEQPDSAALRAQKEEADALRAETADLLKLRNEVGQLRRQVKELDGLQNENRSLRNQNQNLSTQSPAGTPAVFNPPPGYIDKAALKNVGFGSPEAAVQTFWWAMRGSDLATVRQCAYELPSGFGEQSIIKMMSVFQGYAVTGVQNISPDESVVLTVTSNGTNSLRVKRIGSDWKISSRSN